MDAGNLAAQRRVDHTDCRGLHLYFITLAGQGKTLKFDPRDQARSNRQFLFNSQVHENVFFSLVSGTTLITAFEVFINGQPRTACAELPASLDQPWSISGSWRCCW